MKEKLEEIYQALEERRDSWSVIRDGFKKIFPKSYLSEASGNLTEAGQSIERTFDMCIGDMYEVLIMIEELKKEV